MKHVVPASIVIPLYNEAENVSDLIKALNQVAKKLPRATEIVCVDDGSTDQTIQTLKKTKIASSLHLKVVQLSRNFGHQTALLAGISEAKGDLVITMDGDLQHPVSLIPKMLDQHKKGIDIVFTIRHDAMHTPIFKRLSSRLFYAVINMVSDIRILPNASDFRSMNRKSLNALLTMPERRKFLRGMVQWIGFSSVTLEYTAADRKHGQSKYNMFKMLKLALYAITSFTTAPLYIAAVMSVLFFLCAIVYGTYVLYIRFIIGSAIGGWSSVMCAVLAIGGCTSLFFGIIGTYLAAIYDEVKKRPDYVIQK